ncbi:MAG: MFS transporter [Phycisphaerales bacterium]
MMTQQNPGARAPMLQLSIMMFLQFFIWGSWYLSVSLYMLEHGMGEGRFYAYTAGPLGAIIAPFFTGLIADRFFNTEKVLAALFFLAGLFMLALPFVAQTEDSTLFNAVILAHMLCYMPTLALTASLSFAHLPRGGEKFPLVRLWGTIGWIVAGFTLAFLFTRELSDGTTQMGEVRDAQFWLGGGASVILAFYCLTLPKTPAPKKNEPVNVRDLFFMDAWRQLRSVSFSVFIFGSFIVCIPLAAYYASLQQQMDAMGMTHIAAWKNTGTFVEAGMMFLMPFFFRKLGIKWMIVAGIGAWSLRYVLFALGATPEGTALVIAGIALHGICYDFFFVTGQVYVDRVTPDSIRGQAQSMLIFFTQGLGLYVGALVTQELAGRAFGETASNLPEALPMWPKVWWPLAIMAAVIMVAFILFFREDEAAEPEALSDRELGEAEAATEAAPR